MQSDRTLLRWYKEINKRFFQGACDNRVCVRWATDDDPPRWEEKYNGWAGPADDGYHKYQIVLGRDLKKAPVGRLSTLAHEMVHIATELKDDHGDAFERWRQHIASRGIFRKNALLKGRTLF